MVCVRICKFVKEEINFCTGVGLGWFELSGLVEFIVGGRSLSVGIISVLDHIIIALFPL